MKTPVTEADRRHQTVDQLIGEQVLVAVRRIIRAVDLNSRSLLQKHGLTGPQLVVLKSLARTGEVSVGALAKDVHLSQGTVTGIVHRLEKRNLVTRTRGERDKRQIFVQVTTKGETLLREVPSLLQERFVSQFARLADWEKSLILSSVQRIVSMLEAEAIDASPVLTTGPIQESDNHSPEATTIRESTADEA